MLKTYLINEHLTADVEADKARVFFVAIGLTHQIHSTFVLNTRNIPSGMSFRRRDSDGCLLTTADTVAPPPLPQEATADTGKVGGGGGGGGGGVSTNAVNHNPNSNRARGAAGTGAGGGGGGGGSGTASRKGNTNNNTTSNNTRNSQSSAGTLGTGGGGGASKINIDGGDWKEEAVESSMDAR